MNKLTKRDYLNKFKPLEVVVGNDLEFAFRTFKTMVQREKVISLYKEKQQYEKPSIKKRRKIREARKRRMTLALKGTEK